MRLRRQGSYFLWTIGTQMAVMLSPLSSGHSFLPRKVPGTQFCYKLSETQGYTEAGTIRSIENSNYDMEKQTHAMPAYSANVFRNRG
jgi:hypothetical protein